ncbi:MAG: 8-amino-7-oxononanoate synthase [Thermoleophilaceae bacterium]|nr:8-amino-7-oxononanoate synthase [Thermoleophilaceae bacterium]
MTDIQERIDELKDQGLYRRMRLISGPQGPRVLLDGKPVLLLCANNYLGLADNPHVRQAASDAAMRWGVGAGASRLVSGNMTIHRRLEDALAEFKGKPRCLLFGSGYLANTGIISALAGPEEVVFSDALNHASIVDGCRLSRAETFVYGHLDVDHLEWGLQRAEGRGSLIVTDGVFSMDGDTAPLEEIVELARRYDARVMVDEAHATGTVGPGGRGTVAAAGLEDDVDLIVGTLGKSLGAYGAYVCCSKTMAKYLINTARSLIFSTGTPPPVAAAALKALQMLRDDPRLVDRVQRNATVLRAALKQGGLEVEESESHIVPLVIGDAKATVAASQRALERGIFAQAIRPPTVPEGTSRLRLTVMATHTKEELREAARALAIVARPVAPREVEPVRQPMRAPAPVAAGRATGVFDGLAEAA